MRCLALGVMQMTLVWREVSLASCRHWNSVQTDHGEYSDAQQAQPARVPASGTHEDKNRAGQHGHCDGHTNCPGYAARLCVNGVPHKDGCQTPANCCHGMPGGPENSHMRFVEQLPALGGNESAVSHAGEDEPLAKNRMDASHDQGQGACTEEVKVHFEQSGCRLVGCKAFVGGTIMSHLAVGQGADRSC
jgi:hypothetical protein